MAGKLGFDLEAGKSYRLKNGSKATISGVCSEAYLRHVGNEKVSFVNIQNLGPVYGWHESGECTYCSQGILHTFKHLYAIEGPWIDPPKKVPLEATVHADGKVEVDLKPLGEFCPHKMTFRHELERSGTNWKVRLAFTPTHCGIDL
jgi:hypothetical protein